MPPTLTPRQHQILKVITDYIEKHGFSPTLDEIGAAVGISKVTALEHVAVLERKGAVSRETNRARSIRVLMVHRGPLEERVRKKIAFLRTNATENNERDPEFTFEDGVIAACAAIEGVLDA